jgi:hypothetical protein
MEIKKKAGTANAHKVTTGGPPAPGQKAKPRKRKPSNKDLDPNGLKRQKRTTAHLFGLDKGQYTPYGVRQPAAAVLQPAPVPLDKKVLFNFSRKVPAPKPIKKDPPPPSKRTVLSAKQYRVMLALQLARLKRQLKQGQEDRKNGIDNRYQSVSSYDTMSAGPVATRDKSQPSTPFASQRAEQAMLMTYPDDELLFGGVDSHSRGSSRHSTPSSVSDYSNSGSAGDNSAASPMLTDAVEKADSAASFVPEDLLVTRLATEYVTPSSGSHSLNGPSGSEPSRDDLLNSFSMSMNSTMTGLNVNSFTLGMLGANGGSDFNAANSDSLGLTLMDSDLIVDSVLPDRART